MDVVHDITPQSFVFCFENFDQVLAIFTIGFRLPSGFLDGIVLPLDQVLSLASDNATS